MDNLQHSVFFFQQYKNPGNGKRSPLSPSRGVPTWKGSGHDQQWGWMADKIQSAHRVLYPGSKDHSSHTSGNPSLHQHFRIFSFQKKKKKVKNHINCCLELFLCLFCMSACQKCQYITLTSAETKIRSRFSPESHSNNRLCFFCSCGTFPKDTQGLPGGLSPPRLHMGRVGLLPAGTIGRRAAVWIRGDTKARKNPRRRLLETTRLPLSWINTARQEAAHSHQPPWDRHPAGTSLHGAICGGAQSRPIPGRVREPAAPDVTSAVLVTLQKGWQEGCGDCAKITGCCYCWHGLCSPEEDREGPFRSGGRARSYFKSLLFTARHKTSVSFSREVRACFMPRCLGDLHTAKQPCTRDRRCGIRNRCGFLC